MPGRITLTWDDGPTCPVPIKILALASKWNTDGVEFYWNGATMLRQEIRDRLGIVPFTTKYQADVPHLRDGRPLDWLDWLDRERGSRDRRDVALQLLDPAVLDMCRGMGRYIDPSRLCDLIGYHGMTHEQSDSLAHPISLGSEDFAQEFCFFETLVQAAFDAPIFRLRKGRTPYGSGMSFDVEMPPMQQEAYPAMLERSRQARPDFVWNAWEVNVLDYENKGVFDEAAAIRYALSLARRPGRQQARILLHERYYKGESGTLERLFEQLARQDEDPARDEGRSSSDHTGESRGPGNRWPIAKLTQLLLQAKSRLTR